MLQLYLQGWKRFGMIQGRSSRAEYWTFTLVNSVLLVLLIQLSETFFISMYLAVGLLLLSMIPSITIAIRRLHDSNKSGWYFLYTCIPFVGGLIQLVFMLLPGTDGPNKYGPKESKNGNPYVQGL